MQSNARCASVALCRKNCLFADSDKGGERAGTIYSLIETEKLNCVDPEAWLCDTVNPVTEHTACRLDDF